MNSLAVPVQKTAPAPLPDWVQAQLAAQQSQLLDRETELKRRELKIQQLTLELAHYKRIRFGCKSEALSAEQRDLFVECCNEDGAAIVAELEQAQPPAATPRPPKPRGRNPLPPELPRIEHRHEPASCTCGDCGRDLVKIGEDVGEQLDVEPARFFVHRHIRLAAPGLHAWVLIQKYLDHLPLYRIEKISERHGVPIARSTLAQWVGQLGVALQPLVDRLAVLLKQGQVLHADETPAQQLDPGQGKTKRAYLWAYRSNDLEGAPPIVVFDYQTSRSGQHARDFLDGWRGQMMVDDYGGYKEPSARVSSNWRVWRIADASSSTSTRRAAIQWPRKHCAASASCTSSRRRRGRATPRRLALRQREALPRLSALHDWLVSQRVKTADGTGLARAIDYSLKRWTAVLRYVDDGERPIDNNPVENAIRPITLGRRNWLFTGSERAGCRAAAVQSLLNTAKLNGLEPYAWLKETLEKLPTWPYSRIDELLPIRRPQEG